MFGLVMPEFAQRPWRRNQHRPAAVHGGEGCHRDVPKNRGVCLFLEEFKDWHLYLGFFKGSPGLTWFFCLFPLLHLAYLVAKFMFGAMAVLWLALAVPACMLSYQDWWDHSPTVGYRGSSCPCKCVSLPISVLCGLLTPTSSCSPLARWGSLDLIRGTSRPPSPSPCLPAPQPRAADSGGHCRTSTASSRSQWALPDLSQTPERMSDRMPERMSE